MLNERQVHADVADDLIADLLRHGHPLPDCEFCLFPISDPSGLIPLRHPHVLFMIESQKTTFKRDPKKTKAELYEMLAEAVRNTAQPEPKHRRRPKEIAAKRRPTS
jgi:hypothetical protein